VSEDAPTLGARAVRTRAAILGAAEESFAEGGFAATRLEDVAERVGIRRASIVYYFKDKRELYDAVLADVFDGLRARIEAALSSSDPLPERVEAAVSAWVDYVGERPTFARLLLREVADGARDRGAALRQYTRPWFELIHKQVVERPEGGEELADVDPVLMASSVAGSTVFYVAALPHLAPELGLEPTGPGPLAAHREQLLSIVRHLLGRGARRPREARPATRSPSTRAGKRSPRR
jgi:TetR/AcrR family transcriptional regulator